MFRCFLRGKPILYQSISGPPYYDTSNVFLYDTSKKHNVSPTAKKIILQLPSKKTPSQKMIKNPNLSLKYARNAAKFLEFF